MDKNIDAEREKALTIHYGGWREANVIINVSDFRSGFDAGYVVASPAWVRIEDLPEVGERVLWQHKNAREFVWGHRGPEMAGLIWRMGDFVYLKNYVAWQKIQPYQAEGEKQ